MMKQIKQNPTFTQNNLYIMCISFRRNFYLVYSALVSKMLGKMGKVKEKVVKISKLSKTRK